MPDAFTDLQAALDIDQMRHVLHAWWSTFQRWVVDGYDRAPTLMAGMALTAALPLLALLGFVANRWLEQAPPEPGPMPTRQAIASGLGWPHEGFIRLDGDADGRRRRLAGELMSIGREDDNDLMLADASVHRHHAVVHRTPEASFLITDLSGAGGNGIKVNGARVRQALLSDGDRIEVGAVVMCFEARPA